MNYEAKYTEAKQTLEFYADNMIKEIRALVARANAATLLAPGWAIALQNPKLGDVTHGTLRDRMKEFQDQIQVIERLRADAKKAAKEAKTQEVAAAKKASAKKSAASSAPVKVAPKKAAGKKAPAKKAASKK